MVCIEFSIWLAGIKIWKAQFKHNTYAALRITGNCLAFLKVWFFKSTFFLKKILHLKGRIYETCIKTLESACKSWHITHSPCYLSLSFKQNCETKHWKNSLLIQASFFSLARLCVLHPSLNGSSQILNGLLLCSG